MQWILMVFLTAAQNGNTEGFMWHDPVFHDKETCISWAQNNPVEIIGAVDYYYDQWVIDEVVCVREDRLGDLGIQPYIEGTST